MFWRCHLPKGSSLGALNLGCQVTVGAATPTLPPPPTWVYGRGLSSGPAHSDVCAEIVCVCGRCACTYTCTQACTRTCVRAHTHRHTNIHHAQSNPSVSESWLSEMKVQSPGTESQPSKNVLFSQTRKLAGGGGGGGTGVGGICSASNPQGWACCLSQPAQSCCKVGIPT